MDEAFYGQSHDFDGGDRKKVDCVRVGTAIFGGGKNNGFKHGTTAETQEVMGFIRTGFCGSPFCIAIILLLFVPTNYSGPESGYWAGRALRFTAYVDVLRYRNASGVCKEAVLVLHRRQHDHVCICDRADWQALEYRERWRTRKCLWLVSLLLGRDAMSLGKQACSIMESTEGVNLQSESIPASKKMPSPAKIGDCALKFLHRAAHRRQIQRRLVRILREL